MALEQLIEAFCLSALISSDRILTVDQTVLNNPETHPQLLSLQAAFDEGKRVYLLTPTGVCVALCQEQGERIHCAVANIQIEWPEKVSNNQYAKFNYVDYNERRKEGQHPVFVRASSLALLLEDEKTYFDLMCSEIFGEAYAYDQLHNMSRANRDINPEGLSLAERALLLTVWMIIPEEEKSKYSLFVSHVSKGSSFKTESTSPAPISSASTSASTATSSETMKVADRLALSIALKQWFNECKECPPLEVLDEKEAQIQRLPKKNQDQLNKIRLAIDNWRKEHEEKTGLLQEREQQEKLSIQQEAEELRKPEEALKQKTEKLLKWEDDFMKVAEPFLEQYFQVNGKWSSKWLNGMPSTAIERAILYLKETLWAEVKKGLLEDKSAILVRLREKFAACETYLEQLEKDEANIKLGLDTFVNRTHDWKISNLGEDSRNLNPLQVIEQHEKEIHAKETKSVLAWLSTTYKQVRHIPSEPIDNEIKKEAYMALLRDDWFAADFNYTALWFQYPPTQSLEDYLNGKSIEEIKESLKKIKSFSQNLSAFYGMATRRDSLGAHLRAVEQLETKVNELDRRWQNMCQSVKITRPDQFLAVVEGVRHEVEGKANFKETKELFEFLEKRCNILQQSTTPIWEVEKWRAYQELFENNWFHPHFNHETLWCNYPTDLPSLIGNKAILDEWIPRLDSNDFFRQYAEKARNQHNSWVTFLEGREKSPLASYDDTHPELEQLKREIVSCELNSTYGLACFDQVKKWFDKGLTLRAIYLVVKEEANRTQGKIMSGPNALSVQYFMSEYPQNNLLPQEKEEITRLCVEERRREAELRQIIETRESLTKEVSEIKGKLQFWYDRYWNSELLRYKPYEDYRELENSLLRIDALTEIARQHELMTVLDGLDKWRVGAQRFLNNIGAGMAAYQAILPLKAGYFDNIAALCQQYETKIIPKEASEILALLRRLRGYDTREKWHAYHALLNLGAFSAESDHSSFWKQYPQAFAELQVNKNDLEELRKDVFSQDERVCAQLNLVIHEHEQWINFLQGEDYQAEGVTGLQETVQEIKKEVELFNQGDEIRLMNRILREGLSLKTIFLLMTKSGHEFNFEKFSNLMTLCSREEYFFGRYNLSPEQIIWVTAGCRELEVKKAAAAAEEQRKKQEERQRHEAIERERQARDEKLRREREAAEVAKRVQQQAEELRLQQQPQQRPSAPHRVSHLAVSPFFQPAAYDVQSANVSAPPPPVVEPVESESDKALRRFVHRSDESFDYCRADQDNIQFVLFYGEDRDGAVLRGEAFCQSFEDKKGLQFVRQERAVCLSKEAFKEYLFFLYPEQAKLEILLVSNALMRLLDENHSGAWFEYNPNNSKDAKMLLKRLVFGHSANPREDLQELLSLCAKADIGFFVKGFNKRQKEKVVDLQEEFEETFNRLIPPGASTSRSSR